MDVIKQNVSCIKVDTFKKPNKKIKKALSLLPDAISVVVVSKVIPEKKIIRIEMPHQSTSVEICIIVKDVNKLDYNKTIDVWKQRWKRELAKSGVEPPTLSVTFLPLRELTIGYQPYSSKQRLVNTFDVFLADRRIVHHLPSKLGKAFYGRSRGKFPVPVDLISANVVQTVQKASRTTIFAVRGTGTTESVPIGNIDLPLSELKANIFHACDQICTNWPNGGLANIRSIYVQSPGVSFPVYFDAGEAPMSSVCEGLDRLPQALHNKSGGAEKKSSSATRLTSELVELVSKDLPIPQAIQDDLLTTEGLKLNRSARKWGKSNTKPGIQKNKKSKIVGRVKKPKNIRN